LKGKDDEVVVFILFHVNYGTQIKKSIV